MKVSTSLIVAAVLVALSTGANTKTESTFDFASEPSDYDTEEYSLSPSSTESTAENADEVNEKLSTETEDSTGEPPEDLYDFSSPSCSDEGDNPLDSTTDSLTDGSADTEGLKGENSEEDSSTPLYDFSAASCSSDSDPSTSGGSFTDEEKAIWIERHNFFRVAALPWAAGNMKRMNWAEDLAKEAASAAESCSAKTTTGLNVFKATSTDSSLVIDEALNDWVVKPALSNIGSVVPPAKEGDPVGAGLYNSYTQVIWSSTTSVGCAMASCSGGSMVACKYSPVGNDGKSAWFIHAGQAKNCPSGTTAVLGLCVVEGDPANDLIAPIPKGKTSLEVYSTFIPDIMSTILKAEKARDAPGADPLTVISPDGSVFESSKGTSDSETEASPNLKTDEDTEATGEGMDATSEDVSTLDSSSTKDSMPKEGKLSDSSEELGGTDLDSETSPTSSPEGEYSGKVKSNSDTELGSPGGDPKTPPESDELGDYESNKLTSPAESGVTATALSNTQSSAIVTDKAGLSTVAVAAMIVAGVVVVAVVAVFISYRKNQQRQREIMNDGGVEII